MQNRPIDPRFYPPLPQPLPVEQEEEPNWDWIGSDTRPEAQEYSDGISDLFEVGNDPDTDDLVSVDTNNDIIDSDTDGSLDSLTAVSEDDIMGDELGQTDLDTIKEFNGSHQKPRYRLAPRVRVDRRYIPQDTSMRGIR